MSPIKNQSVNWRGFYQLIVLQVYRALSLVRSELCAFVVDDQLKVRRGKKIEGVSRHFDHTLSRFVMGQQVVRLELVSETHSLSSDNQLHISIKQRTGLQWAHRDGRSVVARLSRQGLEMSKPQLVEGLLKRVLRKVFVVPLFGGRFLVFEQENHELGPAKLDVCAIVHEKRQNEISGGG